MELQTAGAAGMADESHTLVVLIGAALGFARRTHAASEATRAELTCALEQAHAAAARLRAENDEAGSTLPPVDDREHWGSA